jgi:DNA replication protein DnaC
LHGYWGREGEAGLLGGCDTAAERYAQVRKLDGKVGGFPNYVVVSLEKRINSETLLADTGTPHVQASREEAVELFDQYLFENQQHAADDDAPDFLGLSSEIEAVPLPKNLGHLITQCPEEHLAHLNSYISEMNKTHEKSYSKLNVCSDAELDVKYANPSTIVEIENVDQARSDLHDTLSGLNSEQRCAYDAAYNCIVGIDPQQLIMFLSGEGGTGKSHLIHALTKSTQIMKGKSEGIFGAVLKAAPTGGAAYNIKGHTWHSALGKSTFSEKFTVQSQLTESQVGTLQRNFKGVSLVIIDEISLLSCEDLYEISFRLCSATGKKYFIVSVMD